MSVSVDAVFVSHQEITELRNMRDFYRPRDDVERLIMGTADELVMRHRATGRKQKGEKHRMLSRFSARLLQSRMFPE